MLAHIAEKADDVPISSPIKIIDDYGAVIAFEIQKAFRLGASVAHGTTDVQELDCEYLCFSGHKLGGPTGIGVLYAKRDRLEQLDPVNLGGGAVETVTDESFTLAGLPMKLEAGTAYFEGVIGLAAACNYLQDLGQSLVDEEVDSRRRPGPGARREGLPVEGDAGHRA